MKVGLPRAAGFTLVEVMIVLAVTGGLFVAIAVTLTGRQGEAQFIQAAQSMQSEVQQVINQAAVGNYPIKQPFSCAASGSTLNFTPISADSQGTNSDCVLFGRVIQFYVTAPDRDPEQDQIFTVAGCIVSEAKPPCSAVKVNPFSQYSPTVVGNIGSYGDFSDIYYTKYGLRTYSVTSGGAQIGAVAFLMEPASLSTSSLNGFVSGGQSIDMVPMTTSGLNQSLDVAASNINTSLVSTPTATIGQTVDVCFNSTSSNQSALLHIGANGSQLGVTMTINSGPNCT